MSETATIIGHFFIPNRVLEIHEIVSYCYNLLYLTVLCCCGRGGILPAKVAEMTLRVRLSNTPSKQIEYSLLSFPNRNGNTTSKTYSNGKLSAKHRHRHFVIYCHYCQMMVKDRQ